MSEMYKPNSYKSKAEAEEPKVEKRAEKVVTGNVKVKKKSEVNKYLGMIINEDAPNIKEFIIMDVVIPTVKKTISEIVDMLLFGGSRGNRRTTNAGYVSYDRFSDRRDDRRSGVTQTRTGYSYNDITLDDRAEAEEVLARMDELMATYGIVRVADLYDLVGISCNYTDNDYGWTNIRNARVVRVRDGYKLELPKALPIK